MDTKTTTCKAHDCHRLTKGGREYCSPHYHKFVFLPKRPLYYTWVNLKRRCRDATYPRYADWGGRGVTICDIWFNDYFAFEEAVGPKPSPFHQLDRKDNNGHYEPGNVRWATPILQARNRRKKKTNTSGITGVHKLKNTRAWQATITVNKRRIHLGTFHNKADAIKSRVAAEAVYF